MNNSPTKIFFGSKVPTRIGHMHGTEMKYKCHKNLASTMTILLLEFLQ